MLAFGAAWAVGGLRGLLATEPDDTTSGFGRANLQRTKRVEITFRGARSEAAEIATLVKRVRALIVRRGRQADGSTVGDIHIEDEATTRPRAHRRVPDEERFAKPLDALRSTDFARFRPWGFDPSLESSPRLDETAVRPYTFQRVPRTTNVLFVAARLTAANGARKVGTVGLRFSRGRPIRDSVSLLEPYRALVLAGRTRVGTHDALWAYVRTGHPDAGALFPLRYETRFEIADKTFSLHGTLTLRA